MTIEELEQAVKETKEGMDFTRRKVVELEKNLYFAETALEKMEKNYETLIEYLYKAQKQEIAERGIK